MTNLPVYATAEERTALTRARDDATALVAAVEQALVECVASEPGSEIEACARKDPESWWLMYAHASLNNACDYLRALGAVWTLREGIPNAPGYTLIRGAAEAAARAIWLVDPSLSPRARVVRGVLERENALDWMRRIVGDSEDARRREATFAATLERAGFTIVDRTCEGERRPRITQLIRTQLLVPIPSGETKTSGGLMYALLSGYAHAEPWATLLGFRPVTDGLGAVRVNIDMQVNLLRLALKLVNGGMCGMVYLAGHDVDQWKNRAVPLVLGR